MPSATRDTGTAPEETVLDVEALATLAPGLDRITPIYVPLDQGFSHSFLLFMFGALDRSRQEAKLPQILSISDGVCESRFTHDQLRIGGRLLAEAAALGITTFAAAGDLGFLGCEVPTPGAQFPGSSPFVTSVGGTDLTLTPANQIADQVVWSTFATDGNQSVGTGGGPSGFWDRQAYQQAPGIGPELQAGTPTRLTPDVASMASFVPGLSVFDDGGGGWGLGGGTSAATPLTAAIVALVARAGSGGRPRPARLPAAAPVRTRPGPGLRLDLLRRHHRDQLPDSGHAGRPVAGGRRRATRLRPGDRTRLAEGGAVRVRGRGAPPRTATVGRSAVAAVHDLAVDDGGQHGHVGKLVR